MLKKFLSRRGFTIVEVLVAVCYLLDNGGDDRNDSEYDRENKAGKYCP